MYSQTFSPPPERSEPWFNTGFVGQPLFRRAMSPKGPVENGQWSSYHKRALDLGNENGRKRFKPESEVVEAAKILVDMSLQKNDVMKRYLSSYGTADFGMRRMNNEESKHMTERVDSMSSVEIASQSQVSQPDDATTPPRNGREHPAHARHLQKKAENLLKKAGGKVTLSDRKAAFIEMLKVFNPELELTTCGSKLPRQFLVNTETNRRFRTYNEAIEAGAMDLLILNVGTSVFIKRNHREIEKRFDILHGRK